MRIAWIGTGVMGRSMALNLMNAGHDLTVHSRTKQRAGELLREGARWADSPGEAAGGSETTFTMVGYPRDVDEVILGAHGILSVRQPPPLIVDCTTSSPGLAQRIFEEARAKGVESLDAPVSGGDTGARNATLSIMVGGSEEGLRKALPLLHVLGKTIVHQGPAGSGQHTKMVNQILIAANMVGLCESLLYARRSGLNPETVLASVGGGAAASWGLANLWPRILKGDLEPGFYVEHFLKDMGIALEESRRMNLSLPGLALAEQLYRAVLANGGARKGTQALILALEALNGQPRDPRGTR